jgi:hypothetical protein
LLLVGLIIGTDYSQVKNKIMSRETFKLKQHQHCVDLLDLAIKAKNIVAEKTRIANNYDNAPTQKWYMSIYTASDFRKQADKYQRIYERILVSYDIAMDKLNSIQ